MSLRAKAALLLCLTAGALYSGAEAFRSVQPPADSRLPKELYERYAVRSEAAEYVLKKNDLGQSPVWCRDYMWEYYLHCFRGMEKELPIQQDLLRLKAMKEENDNALLETLYCFLKNGGRMSQTAEELHIHLSTLKYRMQRIEQTVHFDLHDYNSRMVFLLSYEMLKEREKEQKKRR